MSEARLILTCGLPGAGKTELAKRLAVVRDTVRLTKDEWLWALGSTPWDEPTRKRIERELWRLAREILCIGVSVVLDFGLWARVERDEMRSAARELGVGVELHYLDVAPDELWRRIEARNTEPPWDGHPIRHADLDGWFRSSRRPMRWSWPCLTSLQTQIQHSTSANVPTILRGLIGLQRGVKPRRSTESRQAR